MDIVPLTIWREAQGEGREGMNAVAHVIRNRARIQHGWPADPEHVCLQPYQFSCWNTNDPTRAHYPLAGDAAYQIAQDVWQGVESSPDPTYGATYYISPGAKWDAEAYIQTIAIGHLTFFKDKQR